MTNTAAAQAPTNNADFQNWKVAGFTEQVFALGDGTFKPGGTCDYCSTGIRYVVIAEHRESGARCKLGTTCAEKVGLSPADIAERQRHYYSNLPAAVASREEAAARQAECDRIQAAKEAARPALPREVGPTDALFDLAGNLVTTNLVSGQYGLSWRLPNRAGWVSAFPKRRSTMSKKGFYEGTVAAEQARGGIRGYHFPTDDSYEKNVIAVLDNGADPEMVDDRTEAEQHGYHDQSDPDNVVWVDRIPAPWAAKLAALRSSIDATWSEYDSTDWDSI